VRPFSRARPAYCFSFRTSAPVPVTPDAAAVSESVEARFARSVSSTRTDTVHDPPAGNTGSCCFSGYTKTPFGALTRSEPGAVAVPPEFVTVSFTVRHLPTFSVTGFGFAIESAAGAGVGGAGVAGAC
jgi:hypothetical protein